MLLIGLAWVVFVAWQVDSQRLQSFYATGSSIFWSKHQQYLHIPQHYHNPEQAYITACLLL